MLYSYILWYASNIISYISPVICNEASHITMVWLILCSVFFAILALYYFSTIKQNYWKYKNVPHLRPVPLLGNFGDFLLFKSNIGPLEQKICQQFPDDPLVGVYFGTEPTLIVQDPVLIKAVTTKDFYYFSSRDISDHVHKEVLTRNLFNLYGDEWKVLRQNMTPMFTSAKMKNMFYIIAKCSKAFETLLREEVKISHDIDARGLISRFTMDAIGNCAFGLDTKAMHDKSSPFVKIGQLIFEASKIRGFQNAARLMWPDLFYLCGLRLFPKQIEDFHSKLLSSVFKERDYKPSLRNDFVDLVLSFFIKKTITGDSLKNLRNGEKVKVNIVIDEDFLVAQCFVLFAAGFETSSSTVSFAFYELAKCQKAQDRVREEVNNYLNRHQGILGYDCVNELPYTNQCIDETLRLYPVLGVITREVVEPYTFPNGLKVEKGIRVHLPVFHIQRNPKYFPNPETFDPDRFSPEMKKNITPYSYFPFGEGPRICIGSRFAKMQMMAAIITVLKKYRLELSPGMPTTIDYEPTSLITQSKQGIHLRFIPLETFDRNS